MDRTQGNRSQLAAVSSRAIITGVALARGLKSFERADKYLPLFGMIFRGLHMIFEVLFKSILI